MQPIVKVLIEIRSVKVDPVIAIIFFEFAAVDFVGGQEVEPRLVMEVPGLFVAVAEEDWHFGCVGLPVLDVKVAAQGVPVGIADLRPELVLGFTREVAHAFSVHEASERLAHEPEQNDKPSISEICDGITTSFLASTSNIENTNPRNKMWIRLLKHEEPAMRTRSHGKPLFLT